MFFLIMLIISVSTVGKATQRVGILFRGFLTHDLTFMRKVFITYIRPLLEYNSVVWNPYKKSYISLIEKVQRRFTKRIPSLHLLSAVVFSASGKAKSGAA